MLSAEPKAEADNTETLIIQDITKTESDYCFIVHCFEENNDKHTVKRNLNWYCNLKLYIARATFRLDSYLLAAASR